jgi:hypothetical protein
MSVALSHPLSNRATPLPYAQTDAEGCTNKRCCLVCAHSGPCLTEGPFWRWPWKRTLPDAADRARPKKAPGVKRPPVIYSVPKADYEHVKAERAAKKGK